MYNNIGGKIKVLAKCIFVIDAIAMFVVGIVLLSEELIGAGLLTMFLGPVLAWVSSWLLYGFGELIDKASEIADNTAKEDKQKEKSIKENKTPVAKVRKKPETNPQSFKNVTVINTEEDTDYRDVICPVCKQTLSFDNETTLAVCPWCDTKLEVK